MVELTTVPGTVVAGAGECKRSTVDQRSGRNLSDRRTVDAVESHYDMAVIRRGSIVEVDKHHSRGRRVIDVRSVLGQCCIDGARITVQPLLKV